MSTLLIECLTDSGVKLGNYLPTLAQGQNQNLVHVNSLEEGLVTMLRKMPQTVVLHTDSTGRDLDDFFHLASQKGLRTMVICGSKDVFYGVMDHPDPSIKVKPVLRDHAVKEIVNAVKDPGDCLKQA